VLNVQAQMIVDTHVLVRDPNHREERNEISAPVRIEKFETGHDEKECRHVVAEAVFACKQVKELATRKRVRVFGLPLAVVAAFTKNFFMSDSPCDARDWDCQ